MQTLFYNISVFWCCRYFFLVRTTIPGILYLVSCDLVKLLIAEDRKEVSTTADVLAQ